MRTALTFRDEHLLRVDAAIARCGLFVQAVLSPAPLPVWSYTIGLAALDHPEVVTVGLGPRAAALALGEVHRQVVAGHRLPVGRAPVHFACHDGCDHRTRLLPVAAAHIIGRGPPHGRGCASHLVANAVDYWASVGGPPNPLRVVQLVCPDGAGYMPWQPGYRPGPLGDQSLLDRAPLGREPWFGRIAA